MLSMNSLLSPSENTYSRKSSTNLTDELGIFSKNFNLSFSAFPICLRPTYTCFAHDSSRYRISLFAGVNYPSFAKDQIATTDWIVSSKNRNAKKSSNMLGQRVDINQVECRPKAKPSVSLWSRFVLDTKDSSSMSRLCWTMCSLRLAIIWCNGSSDMSANIMREAPRDAQRRRGRSPRGCYAHILPRMYASNGLKDSQRSKLSMVVSFAIFWLCVVFR